MTDSDFDPSLFRIEPIFSPERATAEYEQLETELATISVIKTEPLSDEEQSLSISPQINPENNFVAWTVHSNSIKEELIEPFSVESEANPFENYEEYEESESEGCVVDFSENIDSSVENEDILTEKSVHLFEHSYFRNDSQSNSENQKEICPEMEPDVSLDDPSANTNEKVPENDDTYFSGTKNPDEVPTSSCTSAYDDIINSFSKTTTLAEYSNLPRYKPSILRKSKPFSVKISRSSSTSESGSCKDAFSDFCQEPTDVSVESSSFFITNIKEEVIVSSVDSEIPVKDVPKKVRCPQVKWKRGRRRKRRKAVTVNPSSKKTTSLSNNGPQVDCSDLSSGLSTMSTADVSAELEDDNQKQRFLSSFQLLHKDMDSDVETGSVETSKTTVPVVRRRNGAPRKLPIRVPKVRLNNKFNTPVDLNFRTFSSDTFLHSLADQNQSVLSSSKIGNPTSNTFLNKCSKCGLNLNLKPRLLAQDFLSSSPYSFNCFFCCASYSKRSKYWFKSHLGGHILSFFYKCCNKELGFSLNFEYDIQALIDKYGLKTRNGNSRTDPTPMQEIMCSRKNSLTSETSQSEFQNIENALPRDYDFDEPALSDGENSLGNDLGSCQDPLECRNDFTDDGLCQDMPEIGETFTLNAKTWESDLQFSRVTAPYSSEMDETQKSVASQDPEASEVTNSQEIVAESRENSQDVSEKPVASLSSIDEKFMFVSDLKPRHFVKLRYDSDTKKTSSKLNTREILSCLSKDEIKEHKLRIQNGCARLPRVVLTRVTDDFIKQFNKSLREGTKRKKKLIDAESWNCRVNRKLEEIAGLTDGKNISSFQTCRKCHQNFVKHSKVDLMTRIEALYPCSRCFWHFDCKYRFQMHCYNVHPFAGPFNCHLCSMKCDNWYQFVFHIKLHDINRFLCTDCSIPVEQNISACSHDALIRHARKANYDFTKDIKEWILKKERLPNAQMSKKETFPSMDVIRQIIGVEPEHNHAVLESTAWSVMAPSQDPYPSVLKKKVPFQRRKQKRRKWGKRLWGRAKPASVIPSVHTIGSFLDSVNKKKDAEVRLREIRTEVESAPGRPSTAFDTFCKSVKHSLSQQIELSVKTLKNHFDRSENCKDFDIFEIYTSLDCSEESDSSESKNKLTDKVNCDSSFSLVKKKRGRPKKSSIKISQSHSLQKTPAKTEMSVPQLNKKNSSNGVLCTTPSESSSAGSVVTQSELNSSTNEPSDFDLPLSPLFDYDDEIDDNINSLYDSLKQCKDILDKDVAGKSPESSSECVSRPYQNPESCGESSISGLSPAQALPVDLQSSSQADTLPECNLLSESTTLYSETDIQNAPVIILGEDGISLSIDITAETMKLAAGKVWVEESVNLSCASFEVLDCPPLNLNSHTPPKSDGSFGETLKKGGILSPEQPDSQNDVTKAFVEDSQYPKSVAINAVECIEQNFDMTECIETSPVDDRELPSLLNACQSSPMRHHDPDCLAASKDAKLPVEEPLLPKSMVINLGKNNSVGTEETEVAPTIDGRGSPSLLSEQETSLAPPHDPNWFPAISQLAEHSYFNPNLPAESNSDIKMTAFCLETSDKFADDSESQLNEEALLNTALNRLSSRSSSAISANSCSKAISPDHYNHAFNDFSSDDEFTQSIDVEPKLTEQDHGQVDDISDKLIAKSKSKNFLKNLFQSVGWKWNYTHPIFGETKSRDKKRLDASPLPCLEVDSDETHFSGADSRSSDDFYSSKNNSSFAGTSKSKQTEAPIEERSEFNSGNCHRKKKETSSDKKSVDVNNYSFENLNHGKAEVKPSKTSSSTMASNFNRVKSVCSDVDDRSEVENRKTEESGNSQVISGDKESSHILTDKTLASTIQSSTVPRVYFPKKRKRKIVHSLALKKRQDGKRRYNALRKSGAFVPRPRTVKQPGPVELVKTAEEDFSSSNISNVCRTSKISDASSTNVKSASPSAQTNPISTNSFILRLWEKTGEFDLVPSLSACSEAFSGENHLSGQLSTEKDGIKTFSSCIELAKSFNESAEFTRDDEPILINSTAPENHDAVSELNCFYPTNSSSNSIASNFSSEFNAVINKCLNFDDGSKVENQKTQQTDNGQFISKDGKLLHFSTDNPVSCDKKADESLVSMIQSSGVSRVMRIKRKKLFSLHRVRRLRDQQRRQKLKALLKSPTETHDTVSESNGFCPTNSCPNYKEPSVLKSNARTFPSLYAAESVNHPVEPVYPTNMTVRGQKENMESANCSLLDLSKPDNTVNSVSEPVHLNVVRRLDGSNAPVESLDLELAKSSDISTHQTSESRQTSTRSNLNKSADTKHVSVKSGQITDVSSVSGSDSEDDMFVSTSEEIQLQKRFEVMPPQFSARESDRSFDSDVDVEGLASPEKENSSRSKLKSPVANELPDVLADVSQTLSSLLSEVQRAVPSSNFSAILSDGETDSPNFISINTTTHSCDESDGMESRKIRSREGSPTIAFQSFECADGVDRCIDSILERINCEQSHESSQMKPKSHLRKQTLKCLREPEDAQPDEAPHQSGYVKRKRRPRNKTPKVSRNSKQALPDEAIHQSGHVKLDSHSRRQTLKYLRGSEEAQPDKATHQSGGVKHRCHLRNETLKSSVNSKQALPDKAVSQSDCMVLLSPLREQTLGPLCRAEEAVPKKVESDTDSTYRLRLSAHPSRIYPSLKKSFKRQKLLGKRSSKSKKVSSEDVAVDKTHQNESASNNNFILSNLSLSQRKSFVQSLYSQEQVRDPNGRWVKKKKPHSKRKFHTPLKSELPFSENNAVEKRVLKKESRSKWKWICDKVTSLKVYDFDSSSECESAPNFSGGRHIKQSKKKRGASSLASASVSVDNSSLSTASLSQTEGTVSDFPENMQPVKKPPKRWYYTGKRRKRFASNRWHQKHLNYCHRFAESISNDNETDEQVSQNEANLPEDSSQSPSKCKSGSGVLGKPRKRRQRKVYSFDGQRALRSRNSDATFSNVSGIQTETDGDSFAFESAENNEKFNEKPSNPTVKCSLSEVSQSPSIVAPSGVQAKRKRRRRLARKFCYRTRSADFVRAKKLQNRSPHRLEVSIQSSAIAITSPPEVDFVESKNSNVQCGTPVSGHQNLTKEEKNNNKAKLFERELSSETQRKKRRKRNSKKLRLTTRKKRTVPIYKNSMPTSMVASDFPEPDICEENTLESQANTSTELPTQEITSHKKRRKLSSQKLFLTQHKNRRTPSPKNSAPRITSVSGACVDNELGDNPASVLVSQVKTSAKSFSHIGLKRKRRRKRGIRLCLTRRKETKQSSKSRINKDLNNILAESVEILTEVLQTDSNDTPDCYEACEVFDSEPRQDKENALSSANDCSLKHSSLIQNDSVRKQSLNDGIDPTESSSESSASTTNPVEKSSQRVSHRANRGNRLTEFCLMIRVPSLPRKSKPEEAPPNGNLNPSSPSGVSDSKILTETNPGLKIPSEFRSTPNKPSCFKQPFQSEDRKALQKPRVSNQPSDSSQSGSLRVSNPNLTDDEKNLVSNISSAAESEVKSNSLCNNPISTVPPSLKQRKKRRRKSVGRRLVVCKRFGQLMRERSKLAKLSSNSISPVDPQQDVSVNPPNEENNPVSNVEFPVSEAEANLNPEPDSSASLKPRKKRKCKPISRYCNRRKRIYRKSQIYGNPNSGETNLVQESNIRNKSFLEQEAMGVEINRSSELNMRVKSEVVDPSLETCLDNLESEEKLSDCHSFDTDVHNPETSSDVPFSEETTNINPPNEENNPVSNVEFPVLETEANPNPEPDTSASLKPRKKRKCKPISRYCNRRKRIYRKSQIYGNPNSGKTNLVRESNIHNKSLPEQEAIGIEINSSSKLNMRVKSEVVDPLLETCLDNLGSEKKLSDCHSFDALVPNPEMSSDVLFSEETTSKAENLEVSNQNMKKSAEPLSSKEANNKDTNDFLSESEPNQCRNSNFLASSDSESSFRHNSPARKKPKSAKKTWRKNFSLAHQSDLKETSLKVKNVTIYNEEKDTSESTGEIKTKAKSDMDLWKVTSDSEVCVKKKLRKIPREKTAELTASEPSAGRKRKQKDKKFRKNSCKVTKSRKSLSNHPSIDTDCSLSSLDPVLAQSNDENQETSLFLPKTESKEAVKLFFSVNLPTLKPAFPATETAQSAESTTNVSVCRTDDQSDQKAERLGGSTIQDQSEIQTQASSMIEKKDPAHTESTKNPREVCLSLPQEHSSTSKLASTLEKDPNPSVSSRNLSKAFNKEDKEKVLEYMSRKIDQIGDIKLDTSSTFDRVSPRPKSVKKSPSFKSRNVKDSQNFSQSTHVRNERRKSSETGNSFQTRNWNSAPVAAQNFNDYPHQSESNHAARSEYHCENYQAQEPIGFNSGLFEPQTRQTILTAEFGAPNNSFNHERPYDYNAPQNSYPYTENQETRRPAFESNFTNYSQPNGYSQYYPAEYGPSNDKPNTRQFYPDLYSDELETSQTPAKAHSDSYHPNTFYQTQFNSAPPEFANLRPLQQPFSTFEFNYNPPAQIHHPPIFNSGNTQGAFSVAENFYQTESVPTVRDPYSNLACGKPSSSTFTPASQEPSSYLEENVYIVL